MTWIYEADWPIKLLPMCQYYQYQCQCNIGQCSGIYRCADVKNMANTDTDINIGASL